MLYKSLILPLLNYCDIVYMNTNQQNLNKLQLVQKMAYHISLCCDNREHIDDMHKSLNLELLSSRHDKHLVIECHKNVHCGEGMPLSKYFHKKSKCNK